MNKVSADWDTETIKIEKAHGMGCAPAIGDNWQ